MEHYEGTVGYGCVTLDHCDRTGAHCDPVMDDDTINVAGQHCDGPMENRHGSAQFYGGTLLHHCGIEEICTFTMDYCDRTREDSVGMLEHRLGTEKHGDRTVEFCDG